MTGYLLKRILFALPVLLGISLVTFTALRLVPGDPALALAGPDADYVTVAAIRQTYGLDRPIHEQYAIYLAHLVQMDFGQSIRTGTPVLNELLARFPTTLGVALSATFVATLLGVFFGVLAAAFQRRFVDYAVMAVAMSWWSIPNYVLGLVLILVFSVTFHILPATAARPPIGYVLPVVTIAAAGAGLLTRQTRAAMLEVLHGDYIRTARAKGLTEKATLFRHALRNALIPVVTVIGVTFGHLLSGTVIVESIFGIPGMGSLLVERIIARDFPTVQGGVLLVAASYVFVNIAVDFAYVAIDKRVRFS